MRPIRPEDEPLIVRFHERLSARSVYLRYFQPLGLSQRTAHERLTRICFVAYDREMALVAEARDDKGATEILGVSRLQKLRGANVAEQAVVVRDEAQHMGLGTELVRRGIEIARVEGIGEIVSTMLFENKEMQAVCRRLGFRLEEVPGRELVRATLKL